MFPRGDSLGSSSTYYVITLLTLGHRLWWVIVIHDLTRHSDAGGCEDSSAKGVLAICESLDKTELLICVSPSQDFSWLPSLLLTLFTSTFMRKCNRNDVSCVWRAYYATRSDKSYQFAYRFLSPKENKILSLNNGSKTVTTCILHRNKLASFHSYS